MYISRESIKSFFLIIFLFLFCSYSFSQDIKRKIEQKLSIGIGTNLINEFDTKSKFDSQHNFGLEWELNFIFTKNHVALFASPYIRTNAADSLALIKKYQADDFKSIDFYNSFWFSIWVGCMVSV